MLLHSQRSYNKMASLPVWPIKSNIDRAHIKQNISLIIFFTNKLIFWFYLALFKDSISVDWWLLIPFKEKGMGEASISEDKKKKGFIKWVNIKYWFWNPSMLKKKKTKISQYILEETSHQPFKKWAISLTTLNTSQCLSALKLLRKESQRYIFLSCTCWDENNPERQLNNDGRTPSHCCFMVGKLWKSKPEAILCVTFWSLLQPMEEMASRC